MSMFCAYVFLVEMLLNVALCQLTPVGPQHIEVFVSKSVTLNCRSSHSLQPVRWQYIITGINRPLMVYDGTVVHRELRGRVEVKFNSETGQSNLTINSAQLNDTGQYQCLEMNNNAHKITFNLTVVQQPTPASGAPQEAGFVVIIVSAICSAVGVCLSAAALIGVLCSRRSNGSSKRTSNDAPTDVATTANNIETQRVDIVTHNEPSVAGGTSVQPSVETPYVKLQSATLEPPRQPSQYDELILAARHHNYVNVMELIGAGASG